MVHVELSGDEQTEILFLVSFIAITTWDCKCNTMLVRLPFIISTDVDRYGLTFSERFIVYMMFFYNAGNHSRLSLFETTKPFPCRPFSIGTPRMRHKRFQPLSLSIIILTNIFVLSTLHSICPHYVYRSF